MSIANHWVRHVAGQGVDEAGFAEDKMLALLRQYKHANPTVSA